MPLPRDDHDLGSGDGIRRGAGPGMPPRAGMAGSAGPGVGPGMPLRMGVGPGMPPPDRPASPGPGANIMASSSSLPPPSDALGAVEYDEDDQPRRRPLLLVGIAVGVILGGIGLALLIARGLEEPDDDVAKITRTEKAQDIHLEDEPEDEPRREPEDEPEDEPKVVKKVTPKKTLTFEQSLANLKARIRSKCSKLGGTSVKIDMYVDKSGGRALTPKVDPQGPVGTCALRIIEGWSFPASEDTHAVVERVSW